MSGQEPRCALRCSGGGALEHIEAFAVRNLLKLPGPLNAAIDALGERVFGGATVAALAAGSAGVMRVRSTPAAEAFG